MYNVYINFNNYRYIIGDSEKLLTILLELLNFSLTHCFTKYSITKNKITTNNTKLTISVFNIYIK